MSHFFAFCSSWEKPPALALFTLLTLGVLLVNGWDRCPNAIAGAVVTGALPFRRAVIPGGGVQLCRSVLRDGG